MIQHIRFLHKNLLAVALVAALPAFADVKVSDAKMRVLPGPVPAAGYLTLTNNSDQTMTLFGATTEAFDRVELHRSVRDADGQARMERLTEIPVAAGESVALMPGGLHLMFMQRDMELSVGDEVEVILHWNQGQELSVPFEVVPANYRGAGH